MIRKYFSGYNKYYILAVFTAALLLLSGIFAPLVMDYYRDNWKEILGKRLTEINIDITEKLASLETELVNESDEIAGKFSSETLKDKEEIIRFLVKNLPPKYVCYIYEDSGELLAWSRADLSKFDADKFTETDELIFYPDNLIDYLAVKKVIGKARDKFLYLFLPVEKEYILDNKFYYDISLNREFSERYDSEFNLIFQPDTKLNPDGRFYNLPVYNQSGDKIGFVEYLKPTRRQALVEVNELFNMTQGIALVLIFIFFMFGISKHLWKSESRWIRFSGVFSFLVILRMLLFFLGLPSAYVENDFTNSAYFSSVFGFGVVKSPLEFAITVFFLLVTCIVAIRYFLDYEKQNEKLDSINVKKAGFAALFALPMFLLSLRGFGAATRSMVFDSTLRYFKEPTLIPELPAALMEINLLLLGISLVLATLIFVGGIAVYFSRKYPKAMTIEFAGLFIIFQFTGYLFDALQKEPQGTPTIRFLFILVIFLLVYFYMKQPSFRAGHFIYVLFAGSLISAAMLNYYNSELERESLKTTALEITRPNEYFLEFLVRETLLENVNLQTRIDKGDINYDTEAFKIWCNSALHRESVSGSVMLLDSSMVKQGVFRFKFSEFYDKVGTDPDSARTIKVYKEDFLYTGNKIIRGIAPLKMNGKENGFLQVAVLYDVNTFGFNDIPGFLSSRKSYINSTIELDKLKIFEFSGNKILKEFSDVKLSNREVERLVNSKFTEYDESWKRTQLNGEEHLIYLLKKNDTLPRDILAVALKAKDTSWSLFDFFKIFFIHTLFILFIIILYSLYNYWKVRKITISFKTTLLVAFLVISIIPLLLLAAYFRNLTVEKNNEAVFYKLGKRAYKVEDYVNSYISITGKTHDEIYRKAAEDLGINFALFSEKDYVFSTLEEYHNIGLMPKRLNPKVYLLLELEGVKETVVDESIENYNYHSFYYKANLGGQTCIMRVSDSFNNILLPFAGVEVDIFLFGSYSLAVLLIIIISTVIANRISSPIRKLTQATKSVAGGDLSLQVDENAGGEIKELIKGFNLMIKKLKQNQAQLAESEREAAWKQMARQVAHEIKNPLTPMKLAVQQLIAAKNDNSPKFEMIFGKVTTMVINQIETLKNIASEFSAFARMPRLNVEKVKLYDVVDYASGLFIEEKASVITEFDNKDLEIDADRDQLQRTLVNLIRNAIQAGALKVNLKYGVVNDTCEIEVADNGKGISPEIAGRIFEENFTTKDSGMGLGLSMAKRFIESLGGRIYIAGTSSEGSSIKIELPLKQV